MQINYSLGSRLVNDKLRKTLNLISEIGPKTSQRFGLCARIYRRFTVIIRGSLYPDENTLVNKVLRRGYHQRYKKQACIYILACGRGVLYYKRVDKQSAASDWAHINHTAGH